MIKIRKWQKRNKRHKQISSGDRKDKKQGTLNYFCPKDNRGIYGSILLLCELSSQYDILIFT